MDNHKITELYFIRHGETDWNVVGKAQGCEHDIDLNDKGRAQAKHTGQYLATYRNDTPFDYIISSGMSRANETAHLIAKQLNYTKPIIKIREFMEKCHGDIGGKTDDELKTDPKFNKYFELLKQYESEPDPIRQRELYYEHNKIFNQLYQTELIEHFRRRIKQGLKKVNSLDGSKILIVSHGGTISELLKMITNIEDYIMGDYKYGSNCHITYMKTYQTISTHSKKKKRQYKIIKLPNTLHMGNLVK